MSDDRLFNKRLGHSEKVNSLTPEEEIAWRTYVNVADDFGVMRFDALSLQNGHDRLAQKSRRLVLRMMERFAEVGLVLLFDHQRREYCYQTDWQDFQKIRYPQRTMHPRIPDWLLAECSRPTRWLHTAWPGGGVKLSSWRPDEAWDDSGKYSGKPSGNDSGNDSRPTRARGVCVSGSVSNSPVTVRSARTAEVDGELGTGDFIRRFCELYAQHRHGARYFIKKEKHVPLVRALLHTYGSERLVKLGLMLLKTDDEWVHHTDRGIEILSVKASWLDNRLAEYEAEHGPIQVAS